MVAACCFIWFQLRVRYVRGSRDVRGAISGSLGPKNARLLLEFDTLAVRVERSSIYQWKALKEKHLLSTQKHSNSKNKCVKKVFEKSHFFNMLALLLEFDKFPFRVARRSMAQSIARRLKQLLSY